VWRMATTKSTRLHLMPAANPSARFMSSGRVNVAPTVGRVSGASEIIRLVRTSSACEEIDPVVSTQGHRNATVRAIEDHAALCLSQRHVVQVLRDAAPDAEQDLDGPLSRAFLRRNIGNRERVGAERVEARGREEAKEDMLAGLPAESPGGLDGDLDQVVARNLLDGGCEAGGADEQRAEDLEQP
jgi:hypothetical protein